MIFSRFALLISLMILHDVTAGQSFQAFNKNNIQDKLAAQGAYHSLFKGTVIYLHRKGLSFGLSYGFWKESPRIQYSFQTGFMYRAGAAFLGNYRDGANLEDSRTRGQFVFMFSPLLTLNIAGDDFVYQEVESFYLGNPNAVYSKYRHAVTLGSTFTISPRGTYKNITTTRNRAQQLFVFGLNFENFNFTLFDDFFPYATDLFQLGDNWDRYFTGGGFLRYRFNDEFTVHLQSEVYTGINRANPFLYPDIVSYNPEIDGSWKRKNFANQDAGHEFFNTSWLILRGTYTSGQQTGSRAGMYVPDVDFYAGSSANWTFFSQNLVHNMIHHDDQNGFRLHYFLPRSRVPGNLEAGGSTRVGRFIKSSFIGGGINYNMLIK